MGTTYEYFVEGETADGRKVRYVNDHGEFRFDIPLVRLRLGQRRLDGVRDDPRDLWHTAGDGPELPGLQEVHR